jgi:hypothetical protein
MMDVEKILENMEDPETLKKFLKDSRTARTMDMNQCIVAAEVILARTIFNSTASLHTDLNQMSSRIEKALQDHSKSLDTSAAANRHARGMKIATWALVGTTICLLLTSFAGLFIR